jgi:hypothetical protein
MLFMAAGTDGTAPVQVTEYREILQAGTGKQTKTTLSEQGFVVDASAPVLINPVTLYLTFDNATKSFPQPEVTGCGGKVQVRSMRSAAGHFVGDDDDKHVAIVVWRDETQVKQADCESFELELGKSWMSGDCDATMVSRTHVQFQRLEPCPSNFDFYTNANDVFIMKKPGAP